MTDTLFKLNVRVVLDRHRGVPLRTQITTQLRDAIAGGVLAPDDPLPSSRSLAAALGVSRNTVVACYLELEGEGWIRGAHGAGTFVARRISTRHSPPIPIPSSSPPKRDVVPEIYDLRPGGVDPTLLKPAEWRKIWSNAAPSVLAADPCGLPTLRDALAGYLKFARGLECSAREIVICAGSAEAMTVLAAALKWSGTFVAVENPGYPDMWNVLRRMDVECIPIDVTEPTSIPEQIRTRRLAGLYLTPSHQYPLGHRLGEDVRREIIAWADEMGSIVVEDDYDGEFSFGIAPSTSMAGLSPESNVVFIGTMSKVLDPGLRLAYLRVPPHLVDAVCNARNDFGPTVSTTIQQGVATFISSGNLSRHIARVRRIYADRRLTILHELRSLPAVTKLVGIDAGLHVVAELSPQVDPQQVISQAHAAGIDLLDLDELRWKPCKPPGLVFGYGAQSRTAIRKAVNVLRALPELQVHAP